MKLYDKIFSIILLALLAAWSVGAWMEWRSGANDVEVVTPVTPVTPKPEPPKPLTPAWTIVEPTRQVNEILPIIRDVESHLWAGHPYDDDSDLITTVHECTHGINGVLRNLFNSPAFYCLENRAVLLPEPATTLTIVAQAVPRELRGNVYSLYLVNSRHDWNNQPSYVFDELSAYTNGSIACEQLGIATRAETIAYAKELFIYSLVVVREAKSTDPQTKAYLMFQAERIGRIDCGQLRGFAGEYFGETWAKENL